MGHKKIIKSLSAISHEMQTPINLISSTASIINQKIDKNLCNDEEIKEYMNNIINNCLKISMLINNITEVNLATISKKECVNPKQFFYTFYDTVLPYCNENDVNLTPEFNVPKEFICISVITTERILLNLITNAIKYSKKNKKIKLKMYTENDNIIFSVKDNGIGIAQEDINKVTDEFYRVNTEESKGLGLGLNLVKKYTEQMGGTITIKSQLKKGTEVIISIPSVEEDSMFLNNETDYIYSPEKSLFKIEFSQLYSL